MRRPFAGCRLRAQVRSDEKGVLVVELDGSASAIEEGIAYVRSIGAKVETLAAEVAYCNGVR